MVGLQLRPGNIFIQFSGQVIFGIMSTSFSSQKITFLNTCIPSYSIAFFKVLTFAHLTKSKLGAHKISLDYVDAPWRYIQEHLEFQHTSHETSS